MAGRIAVFGASGLIGEAICRALIGEGLDVVPIARRFSQAQRQAFGERAVEADFVLLDAEALSKLLEQTGAELFVNCVGVLQDGPKGSTADAHGNWIGKLLRAMPSESLLVQISIPGNPADDKTEFSRSKRVADAVIARSGRPFVILRPGFVLGPAAYGGSALMRALAMLPFSLPRQLSERPFQVTNIEDIGRTIEHVAKEWRAGFRTWQADWGVMSPESSTVGDVLSALRRHLGGPIGSIILPNSLLGLGSWAGDVASRLGWAPPIRSTALVEMQRGVAGDPRPWMAATSIVPRSLEQTLWHLAPSVQEKWFARLFLLKPLVFGGLALFWIVSGLIALTIAQFEASKILHDLGLPPPFALALTIATSLLDIAIGLASTLR